MKKTLLFLISIVCLNARLQAQSSTRKVTLHSVTSIGLLNGSKGAGFSIQSILGVTKKKSFAGIGVGIDQYSFRTIPVFVDLRQQLGRKKRSIYLYADAGYNFGWLTEKEKNLQNQQFASSNFRGGLYYDAGAGYAVTFRSNNALLLSLGYCYKELENKMSTSFCNLTACVAGHETYTYHMPRILLKVGWRF